MSEDREKLIAKIIRLLKIQGVAEKEIDIYLQKYSVPIDSVLNPADPDESNENLDGFCQWAFGHFGNFEPLNEPIDVPWLNRQLTERDGDLYWGDRKIDTSN